MILTPLQKLHNNLGKIIVATSFEWLPKVQKIAQSGHTVQHLNKKNLSKMDDSKFKRVQRMRKRRRNEKIRNMNEPVTSSVNRSERWNIQSTHFITLFYPFQNKHQIYGVLGCCVLLKNQNLVSNEMGQANQRSKMMRALFIPSLWNRWLDYLFKAWALTAISVTSKNCPKMISLTKLKILTPLQILPKNVGDLGKLIAA